MSFSEQVLAELSSYLEKTLSPDPTVRRPGKFTFSIPNPLFWALKISLQITAEKYLQDNETQENFGPLLLCLCSREDLALHLRVVASVTFKNFIKRTWKLTEETDFVDKITANDRQSVR